MSWLNEFSTYRGQSGKKKLTQEQVREALNPTYVSKHPFPSEYRAASGEIFRGIYESSAAINESGGKNMDESTKMLIDRLDQDLRDHKQEVRDRDTKILTDAQEREQRYRTELVEQHKLFREEAKEREERMMSAMNEMKAELKESFKDVKDESKTTRNTVIALTISVILGVATMVLAVFLAK
ncbi:hypothetical protein [Paenibacillus apiarius]|uniref:Uncharacterized protein n=1 Tax=Paenibacillus apiarius TaxID=46240 RepID=A0ABT4DQR7_9BACL|nr:hypothetical protein [Paenibacillus apiarius]MCY9513328.1 hypothetical protein [Paenibacillus apiarius]MCY9519700.1 hypothetical protein [Paenibacillus apiarius]MCY9553244.1 hypothetical protein [Paenibacillus apiarius]MCY9557094.1 hypothetical protein [Paenibacillus apiarius]MCY9682165.1 hypothetical protein [Paenibacillus apiarius]